MGKLTQLSRFFPVTGLPRLTSRKIMNRCAHCNRDIVRSCLVKPVEEGDSNINLVCTICNREYQVPNTEEQRASIKFERGKPFAKETFYSFGQLGVGDLVKLQATEQENSSVYVVVVEVNSEEVKAKVSPAPDVLYGRSAETPDTDGEWMSLDALQNKNAMIYRFMPLDCLPRMQLLERVKNMVSEAKQSQKEMRYFGVWCKTDISESLEVEQISLYQICKTIFTRPWQSYQEWRNIGAGINQSSNSSTKK